MRIRTVLYFLSGTLLAGILVSAATFVAAKSSTNPQDWMNVQKQSPLLWMMDASGIIIFLGSIMLGLTSGDGGSSDRASSRSNAQSDYEEIVALRARVDTMERERQDRRDNIEEAAGRMAEHAFSALVEHIEANAAQLESITLALRYQRAEMQSFRKALKTGELSAESVAPPPLDSPKRPKDPILPDWRAQVVREPEPETEIETDEAFAEEPHVEAEATQISDAVVVEEPASTALEPAVAAEEDDVDTRTSAEEQDDEQPEPETKSYAETTVSAGTASVHTLEIDLAAEERKREEDEAAKRSEAAKAAAAALEFTRSKQKNTSIFRPKR